MMFRSLLILVALTLAACGPPGPPNPTPPPTEPGACEPKPTEEFRLGVIVPDSRRWFRAFEEGCDTIEMETGLQGGWHIEPAIQAPRGVAEQDLGGTMVWEVFADGEDVARAELEMFRNFWQSLEGGPAYWGDYVIFYGNPEDLVGSELVIELTVEFDEESSLDDLSLSQTVLFVDEDDTSVF